MVPPRFRLGLRSWLRGSTLRTRPAGRCYPPVPLSIPKDKAIEHLGLPHRPPFVFVRQLLAREPGVSADCETSFDPNDPMFAGHFPGNPLVPGVLLTEALAQTAGIAAASGYPEGARPLFLLSAIRNMKFPRPARPGDAIQL